MNFPWWRINLNDAYPVVSVKVTSCEEDEEHDDDNEGDESLEDTPAGLVVTVAEDPENLPEVDNGKNLEDDEYIPCGSHEVRRKRSLEGGDSVTIACPDEPVATDVFIYLPRVDSLRIHNVESVIRAPGNVNFIMVKIINS